MSEGIPTPEKAPIKVTREEFNRLDDEGGAMEFTPEFKAFLSEKGIQVDSGDVVLDVEGERRVMVTNRNDFGTIVGPL